jgi:lactoylglutathione lyase
MKILEITPVLVVDRIEPSLALWTERLGFEKPVEVPHEGALGFAMFVRDGHPVMMQTRASIAADEKAAADAIGARGVALYIDVDSLDAALEATSGLPRIFDVRETFYGAREFAVADPSGQVLIFAEHVEKK